MRHRIIAGGLVALLAALGTVAWSQDEAAPKSPRPSVETLIDQLGHEEFAVREKAEKELLARGEEARAALAKAAKEHRDTHVRYEAERLLARLAGKDRPEGSGELREVDPDVRRLEDGMTELLKELETRGFLSDEAFERLFERFAREPFAVPEIRIPELRMDSPFRAGGVLRGSILTGDRRIDYERAADGRVTVKITKGGETEVYEAESLEALKEKHPDVHSLVEKHFGGDSFRVEVRPFPFRDGFRPFGESPWPRGLREAPPPDREAAPPDGFRLGVWIGEITEPLREHLSLKEGEGLLVESVVPGSLADRLGIRRFDVILAVNGTPTGDAQDVQQALSGVEEGGAVNVKVVRKGAPTTLQATR